MNINSVKFRSVDNVYKSNKAESKPLEKKKTDTIEISELGKYLNKVSSSKEDIDIQKVSDIRKRIENGTYLIDSGELAKKIIESMKGEK